ncbi:MAG: hypothetical protein ACREEM_29060 [Blastocatellia bacterium]
MFAARITPKLVAAGFVGELLLLALLYLPAALGLTARFRLTEAIVMTIAGLLAYGIATLLGLEIAAEYRQARWSRLAWLLLAASAGLSLVKRSAGSPLLDFVAQDYRSGPLRGLLDNLLLAPANLCMLGGLLAMWWAIHRIGLGFGIERRDYAAMAAVGALFLTLLVSRESLSQGQSPFLLSRVLQPLNLALLGVCSAFGVVLHRYAVEMGDGKLAVVMRWLMAFMLLRGLLVLTRSFVLPQSPLALDSPADLNQWTFDILWQAVHWCLAMAAVHRAHLTVSAAAQLKELRETKAATIAA